MYNTADIKCIMQSSLQLTLNDGHRAIPLRTSQCIYFFHSTRQWMRNCYTLILDL